MALRWTRTFARAFSELAPASSGVRRNTVAAAATETQPTSVSWIQQNRQKYPRNNQILISKVTVHDNSAAVQTQQLLSTVFDQLQSPAMYNNQLKSLRISHSKLDDYLEICQTMTKNNVRPTSETYELLFNICAQFYQATLLEKLWTDMIEMDIKPGLATYNEFLDACTRLGMISTAFERYDEMSKNNIAPNAKTYETLLLILSKTDDIGLAAVIFSDAVQKISPSPRMIESYFTIALRHFRWRKLDTALPTYIGQLSTAMLRKILYCVSRGEKKEHNIIKMCLEQLKKLNTQLDEGTVMALLSSSAVTWDVSLTEELFGMLNEAVKGKLQEYHFALLLDVYAHINDTFKTLRTLHIMSQLHIPCPNYLLNRFVDNISKSTEAVDATYALLESEASQSRGTIAAVNAILDACRKLRDRERMIATYAEIGNLGLKADVYTFHVLLREAAQSRQLSLARWTIEQMNEHKIAFDSNLTSRVIDTLISCGDIDEALKMQREASAQNISLNQMQLAQFVRALLEANRLDECVEQLKNLSKRKPPSLELSAQVYQAFKAANRLYAVKKYIDHFDLSVFENRRPVFRPVHTEGDQ